MRENFQPDRFIGVPLTFGQHMIAIDVDACFLLCSQDAGAAAFHS
jgi:hypothetical protein